MLAFAKEKVMFPENDMQFQQSKIKAIEISEKGYRSFTSDTGWSIGGNCDHECDFVPKIGQALRLYGPQFGIIRGIFVDDHKVHYRSIEEHRIYQEEQNRIEAEKKKESYESNRADFEKRYEALPFPFQRRINKFRETKWDYFRYNFEPYEMDCCEQAVAIAEHFMKLFPDKPEAMKALMKWKELPYDEQQEAMPAIGDEHSGNTFGISVRLAQHWIHNPDLVVLEHGAMVPLTGCKDYGCPHPYNSPELDRVNAATANKETQ